MSHKIDLATWQTWTPVCTGFSGTPTTTNCKYKRIDNLVILQIEILGTSNSTTCTFSLPFEATSDTYIWSVVYTQSNSVDRLGLVRVFASNSTTVATAYGGFQSAVGASPLSEWANSGTKNIRGTIYYECV